MASKFSDPLRSVSDSGKWIASNSYVMFVISLLLQLTLATLMSIVQLGKVGSLWHRL